MGQRPCPGTWGWLDAAWVVHPGEDGWLADLHEGKKGHQYLPAAQLVVPIHDIETGRFRDRLPAVVRRVVA